MTRYGFLKDHSGCLVHDELVGRQQDWSQRDQLGGFPVKKASKVGSWDQNVGSGGGKRDRFEKNLR